MPQKKQMEKTPLFIKDTNLFFVFGGECRCSLSPGYRFNGLYKSVAVKVKSVCGCWPMWLHYKIETKKTGPRGLLWWTRVSFAGEFSSKPCRKNMISTFR
jgi:hypothetical protein